MLKKPPLLAPRFLSKARGKPGLLGLPLGGSKGTGTGTGGPPPESFFILKEDGFYILQENGDKIQMEEPTGGGSTFFVLKEDNFYVLQENSDKIIMES